MTPDIFRHSKNLFLIFPPGCGGNHLANLLSMHPVFAPRYSHENYYEDMVRMYEDFFNEVPESMISCTAHFSDLSNLQLSTLQEYTEKIVKFKEPYIFCSHAVEYAIRNHTGSLDPFKDRIFCLFTKPKGNNPLIFNRMNRGAWYHGEPDKVMFRTVLVADMYKPDVFASVTGTEEDKIFVIDSDIFYTIDGFDYLNDVVQTKLGVKLPEICRKLHTQYIEYSSIIFGNS